MRSRIDVVQSTCVCLDTDDQTEIGPLQWTLYWILWIVIFIYFISIGYKEKADTWTYLSFICKHIIIIMHAIRHQLMSLHWHWLEISYLDKQSPLFGSKLKAVIESRHSWFPLSQVLGQEDVGKPQPSKQPNRLIQFYVHSHQSCTAESSSVLCTDVLYYNGTVLYCNGTVMYLY